MDGINGSDTNCPMYKNFLQKEDEWTSIQKLDMTF